VSGNKHSNYVEIKDIYHLQRGNTSMNPSHEPAPSYEKKGGEAKYVKPPLR